MSRVDKPSLKTATSSGKNIAETFDDFANATNLRWPGWPDWAIYRHLGDFLKHMATIFWAQIAQIFGDFLGDFWKRAKILNFML